MHARSQLHRLPLSCSQFNHAQCRPVDCRSSIQIRRQTCGLAANAEHHLSATSRIRYREHLPGSCHIQRGVTWLPENDGTRPTFTDQEALLYFHSRGRPRKLEVVATKPMTTHATCSLASPQEWRYRCSPLRKMRITHFDYTHQRQFRCRQSQMGPPSLALATAAPLAAKPVIKGKAVLFKRLADMEPRQGPRSSRRETPTRSSIA